jgi:lysophospholipase L1-like esterase
VSEPHRHPEKEANFDFGSIPIKLDMKDWIIVLMITLSGALLLPWAFERSEKFTPVADYRVHFEQSNDYWALSRWAKTAAEKNNVLFLGDSAIWGLCADNTHTLTAELNRNAGKEHFENLGVSALHATALHGLVRYYDTSIRDRQVVLQFAPLWSINKEQDLQDKENMNFSHPKLAPQFGDAPIACNTLKSDVKPDERAVFAHVLGIRIPINGSFQLGIEDRLGVTMQRLLPQLMLSDHLISRYLENKPLAEWSLNNPYASPLSQVKTIGLEIPGGPTPHQGDAPTSWTEKKKSRQDYPWVMPSESYQFEHFKKTLALLKERGNQVFVLVGPFNPHILEDGSRARYGMFLKEVDEWLKAGGVPHALALELSSELYSDTSHPLPRGYKLMADDLWANPAFKAWLDKSRPVALGNTADKH